MCYKQKCKVVSLNLAHPVVKIGTLNRCVKSITNSQPFVNKMKKCQVPLGGGIFLTHTVYDNIVECLRLWDNRTTPCPKKTCDYIFYNNFNNKCPI